MEWYYYLSSSIFLVTISKVGTLCPVIYCKITSSNRPHNPPFTYCNFAHYIYQCVQLYLDRCIAWSSSTDTTDTLLRDSNLSNHYLYIQCIKNKRGPAHTLIFHPCNLDGWPIRKPSWHVKSIWNSIYMHIFSDNIHILLMVYLSIIEHYMVPKNGPIAHVYLSVILLRHTTGS